MAAQDQQDLLEPEVLQEPWEHLDQRALMETQGRQANKDLWEWQDKEVLLGKMGRLALQVPLDLRVLLVTEENRDLPV